MLDVELLFVSAFLSRVLQSFILLVCPLCVVSVGGVGVVGELFILWFGTV